jgi:uncharacterized integral membrane protein (TIGR00698 family)
MLEVTTLSNNQIQHQRDFAAIKLWIYGVSFTFVISILGYGLAIIPGFNQIGPMACAILLAIVYRQFFGYPEQLRSGIQFSSKKLLRLAIILYGLKLNIDVIYSQGLSLLVKDALVITFAILAMVWLGKWLKADPNITFLLGVGTGICGAAAIAVVSSITKTKDEDTAMSVGIIALMGTIFSVIYTILRPFLPLSPIEYGVWSGLSLHEIAHVTLASAPAGQDGLAMALVAKLGRVLLLVPLSIILIYLMKKKQNGESTDTKIDFPWFLVGFILMSILGSYVLGEFIILPPKFMDGVSIATTFLMTSAMVGLGLNISLNNLRKKALRPMIIIFVVSVALSTLTFFIV